MWEKYHRERTIQYVKDRTESFDDYFPCRSERRRCKLEHILNWFKMFIDMHNRGIIYTNAKWTQPSIFTKMSNIQL